MQFWVKYGISAWNKVHRTVHTGLRYASLSIKQNYCHRVPFSTICIRLDVADRHQIFKDN